MATTLPSLPTLSTSTTLSGEIVRRLMRAEGVTIRGLAARMDVTLVRVREVRANGVEGAAVRDWVEALTGFVSVTWTGGRTVEEAAETGHCGVCREALAVWGVGAY